MTALARRLRIAVLSRNFSPMAGGAERYAIALVEKLASKHEIHVFAQSIHHNWPGVCYHRIRMPFRKPRWINQLWFASATWWATRQGFDLVHSHENTWHGQVQTVHVLPVKHTLFDGRRGWQRLARWVKVLSSPRLLAYLCLERQRYALKKGRAVVLISETLQAIFLRAYPGAAAMTSLLTPGIDLPAFPIDASQRQQARAQLGLPQQSACILFVGNDFRKKGLTTVLAAMKILPPHIVLAVAGDSAQRPLFQQQVVQAGLVDRVFFLGALNDMPVAYRAADALVHPTLEDTFAMVVLEAMAHGLPVAVSSAAYCGISSFLTPGLNACLLEHPRDVQQVAAAMASLVGDRVLQQRMGHAARLFAMGFQWESIAERQAQIYQTLVSES